MNAAIEVHPFPPFLPANATHIVLGSFPTHNKNWRFNSYYLGRSNFFWRMLRKIYNHHFEHTTGDKAAIERTKLCAAKGIAICDTIYKCKRKIATSSKDSDLVVVERMNILDILKKHPSIHSVILTGSSGIVSAHKIFFEHLCEHEIPYEIQISKPPIQGNFILNERRINTHTLYSTSGINIGRYKEAVEQYRKVLFSVS